MRATGRHRSLELAERHARQLARRHGGQWEIVSRRTDDGRFSARGHNFTFEKVSEEEEEEEEEEEPEPTEYVVSASYKGSKSNPVNIQFSIFAPANATRENVIKAINAHIDRKSLPAGYDVRSMNWNGHDSKNITRDTQAFSAPLAFSTLRVSRDR